MRQSRGHRRRSLRPCTAVWAGGGEIGHLCWALPRVPSSPQQSQQHVNAGERWRTHVLVGPSSRSDTTQRPTPAHGWVTHPTDTSAPGGRHRDLRCAVLAPVGLIEPAASPAAPVGALVAALRHAHERPDAEEVPSTHSQSPPEQKTPKPPDVAAAFASVHPLRSPAFTPVARAGPGPPIRWTRTPFGRGGLFSANVWRPNHPKRTTRTLTNSTGQETAQDVSLRLRHDPSTRHTLPHPFANVANASSQETSRHSPHPSNSQLVAGGHDAASTTRGWQSLRLSTSLNLGGLEVEVVAAEDTLQHRRMPQPAPASPHRHR